MAGRKIQVPDIGDFDAVDVVEVLVSAGDTVAKDDPLITLESDKATMDVPAPFGGKVAEVKVSRGDKVSAGDVIALVEEEAGAGEEEASKSKRPDSSELKRPDSVPAETAEDSHQAPAEGAEEGEEEKAAAEESTLEGPTSVSAHESESDQAPSQSKRPDSSESKRPASLPADRATGPTSQKRGPAPEKPSEPPRLGEPIDEAAFRTAHASPSVRRFARRLGVDLGKVEGSGRKGRILEDDVAAYVKRRLGGPAEGAPGGPSGAGLPQVATIDFSQFGEIERRPLSRIQKIAGPRLQAAWVNVPHVTQFDEADITELEAFRKEHAEEAKEDGFKLTLLSFIMKACVPALKKFPAVNSSLAPEGGELVLKRYVHIGFALDTEGGLLVPVIRDADRKGVFELARELADLSERGRNGKLKPDEMKGASFTISSLGGIGGTAFTPIVNAPEVAILGVSRAVRKPVWQEGEFVPRLMLPLSFSYDHRVIDGAMAVRFTTYLAEILADLREVLL